MDLEWKYYTISSGGTTTMYSSSSTIGVIFILGTQALV